MSLGKKVIKESYYSLMYKVTEGFNSVEEAAKKKEPSLNLPIEILSRKFDKANIKLNEKADDGLSKKTPKSEGKAKWVHS